MNMSTPSEQLWRTVAVGLLTLVLGAGGEWFFRGRDSITKDDMAIGITPIQKQLDDLETQQGENRKAIEQLDIDIARISEALKITAHPSP